ncbi:MAG: hypothetical protein K6G51_08455, partial [Sphaerochaetaceae bacterium]|nr:hypothetical protein [Sphaerochaetaceae bacterium]
FQLSQECLIVPFVGTFEENNEFMRSLERGKADIEKFKKSFVEQDGYILAFTEDSELPEEFDFSIFYLDIYQLEKILGDKKGFLIDANTRPLVLDRKTILELVEHLNNNGGEYV